MTPDMGAKRAFVHNMRDGDRWHRRVKRMPDAQITAIYLKEQRKTEAAAERKQQQRNSDTPF